MLWDGRSRGVLHVAESKAHDDEPMALPMTFGCFRECLLPCCQTLSDTNIDPVAVATGNSLLYTRWEHDPTSRPTI